MLEIVKVPMPTKKIIKAKCNNKIYVYYVTKTFRNEKNQPTNEKVVIGKLDKETGMLIPNDTYFKYYDCTVKIEYKGEKDGK